MPPGWFLKSPDGQTRIRDHWKISRHSIGVDSRGVRQLPPNAVRLMPGSSWGVFTIACTIPIALFVGLYMYKIRPGKSSRLRSSAGADARRDVCSADGFRKAASGRMFNLSAAQVTLVDGGLRIRRGRAAGVGAARARAIISQLSQDRHDCSARARRDRWPIQRFQAPAFNTTFFARRPDREGADFPVPLHHHHVRGDQRISRAGLPAARRRR